jgi:nitroreductase
MQVSEAIFKRRSIRRFKQDAISLQTLKKLVDAARVAPSAANLQPLRYTLVVNPELCKRLFPALRWAGYIAPRGNPPPNEEPTAYVVVLVNKDVARHDYQLDAGAAIENLILTALEAGIGSCWLGAIDREKIRDILDISEDFEIESVIALGYPNEEPVMELMKDSIEYWKDQSGRLHVPKRSLEEVLEIRE